jgi:hypothetical protein
VQVHRRRYLSDDPIGIGLSLVILLYVIVAIIEFFAYFVSKTRMIQEMAGGEFG